MNLSTADMVSLSVGFEFHFLCSPAVKPASTPSCTSFSSSAGCTGRYYNRGDWAAMTPGLGSGSAECCVVPILRQVACGDTLHLCTFPEHSDRVDCLSPAWSHHGCRADCLHSAHRLGKHKAFNSRDPQVKLTLCSGHFVASATGSDAAERREMVPRSFRCSGNLHPSIHCGPTWLCHKCP